jgi:hypothetical protein
MFAAPCVSTITTCPQARRVEGGNCWRAFRRVRLVVEQVSQEVKKNEVSNHKTWGVVRRKTGRTDLLAKRCA